MVIWDLNSGLTLIALVSLRAREAVETEIPSLFATSLRPTASGKLGFSFIAERKINGLRNDCKQNHAFAARDLQNVTAENLSNLFWLKETYYVIGFVALQIVIDKQMLVCNHLQSCESEF
ncbi:MAG TPA: hypothetical protein VL171_04865 [Verrucomicrobiae bacterium]|nr:hypothetical protein [Verrucomicrobiae bacterium]